MRTVVSSVLVLLSLAVAPARAHAIDWPSASAVEPDPIRELRWGYVARWVAPNHPRLAPTLRALDAAPSDRASWFAWRAVLLRLNDQEDLSRAALTTALRMQPDLAVSDSDVGLTRAWLAARARDWSGAFEAATVPLSRMGPSDDRERLVLDVARWSMARGPEGLLPAYTLLRQYLSAGAARSPMVPVTTALALARMNRLDEARVLVRAVADVLRPDLGSDHYPLGDGALVLGEGDAAIGVALLLVGRGRDAVEPLTRASTSVPMPWRPWVLAQLAVARRSPAAPPESPTPPTLLPNLMRVNPWHD